jgi:hypothetical protein
MLVWRVHKDESGMEQMNGAWLAYRRQQPKFCTCSWICCLPNCKMSSSGENKFKYFVANLGQVSTENRILFLICAFCLSSMVISDYANINTPLLTLLSSTHFIADIPSLTFPDAKTLLTFGYKPQ